MMNYLSVTPSGRNRLPMAAPEPRNLGVFYDPPSYPWLGSLGIAGGLVSRLNGYLNAQRAPRSLDYMRSAMAAIWPEYQDVQVLAAPADLTALNLNSTHNLVLLWPDANGMGWAAMERQVRRCAPPECKVVILNGRKRTFDFGSAIHQKLRRRRVFEKSLLMNVLFGVLFLVSAPFLWIYDLARGKS